MKRSKFNRLNSQFAYPVIISNLLSRPAWTWRIYFGPISSTAADAAVLIGNTCLVWNLMCLTEALMIKALLLTNFKQFIGINDSFFSIFAGLINIGFSLGSHIALFILGSLGSDEILTGVQGKPRQICLFYEVIIGTIITISFFSLMVIGIKKFEAYRKDKKLVKDVNVMINNMY